MAGSAAVAYPGVTAAILLFWIGVLLIADWATDGGIRRYFARLGRR